MRKKAAFFLLAWVLCVSAAGCAPLIVGAAVGVAGGYAVSRDTMQGDSDKSFDSLWNAAIEVSKYRGVVKKDDFKRGTIEVMADSSKVWIQLIRITDTATRVRVSSRKFHFPNLALAQELFTKIIDVAK